MCGDYESYPAPVNETKPKKAPKLTKRTFVATIKYTVDENEMGGKTTVTNERELVRDNYAGFGDIKSVKSVKVQEVK